MCRPRTIVPMIIRDSWHRKEAKITAPGNLPLHKKSIVVMHILQSSHRHLTVTPAFRVLEVCMYGSTSGSKPSSEYEGVGVWSWLSPWSFVPVMRRMVRTVVRFLPCLPNGGGYRHSFCSFIRPHNAG